MKIHLFGQVSGATGSVVSNNQAVTEIDGRELLFEADQLPYNRWQYFWSRVWRWGGASRFALRRLIRMNRLKAAGLIGAAHRLGKGCGNHVARLDRDCDAVVIDCRSVLGALVGGRGRTGCRDEWDAFYILNLQSLEPSRNNYSKLDVEGYSLCLLPGIRCGDLPLYRWVRKFHRWVEDGMHLVVVVEPSTPAVRLAEAILHHLLVRTGGHAWNENTKNGLYEDCTGLDEFLRLCRQHPLDFGLYGPWRDIRFRRLTDSTTMVGSPDGMAGESVAPPREHGSRVEVSDIIMPQSYTGRRSPMRLSEPAAVFARLVLEDHMDCGIPDACVSDEDPSYNSQEDPRFRVWGTTEDGSAIAFGLRGERIGNGERVLFWPASALEGKVLDAFKEAGLPANTVEVLKAVAAARDEAASAAPAPAEPSQGKATHDWKDLRLLVVNATAIKAIYYSFADDADPQKADLARGANTDHEAGTFFLKERNFQAPAECFNDLCHLGSKESLPDKGKTKDALRQRRFRLIKAIKTVVADFTELKGVAFKKGNKQKTFAVRVVDDRGISDFSQNMFKHSDENQIDAGSGKKIKVTRQMVDDWVKVPVPATSSRPSKP